MSEWQPIETAPKDERVFLYRPACPYQWAQRVCGRFNSEPYISNPRPYWSHDVERLSGKADARKNPPTHWMPLPEPPEAA